MLNPTTTKEHMQKNPKRNNEYTAIYILSSTDRVTYYIPVNKTNILFYIWLRHTLETL